MNRRSFFGGLSFLSGSLFKTSIMLEAQPLRAMIGEISIDKQLIERTVKQTISNIKFSLPDGSYAILREFDLTSSDEHGTIWNAPSTG